MNAPIKDTVPRDSGSHNPTTGASVRRTWVIRIALVVLAFCLLVLIVYLLLIPGADPPAAPVVSLATYTNLPNSSRPYAVFSIENRGRQSIKFNGTCYELETRQNRMAPIVNRNYQPALSGVLKPGDSAFITLAEPTPDTPDRMRMLVDISPYGWKQRLTASGPGSHVFWLRMEGAALVKLQPFLWKLKLPFTIQGGAQVLTTNSPWVNVPFPTNAQSQIPQTR